MLAQSQAAHAGTVQEAAVPTEPLHAGLKQAIKCPSLLQPGLVILLVISGHCACRTANLSGEGWEGLKLDRPPGCCACWAGGRPGGASSG